MEMQEENFFSIDKIPIDGLGNCQFASIAHQCGKDPQDMNVIAKYRNEICNYMQSHENQFKPFMGINVGNNSNASIDQAILDNVWNEHIRKMRELGEWGTHLELIAASRLYNLDIHIFRNDRDGIFRFNTRIGRDGDKVIRLIYDGLHYDSLIITDDDFNPMSISESIAPSSFLDFDEDALAQLIDMGYNMYGSIRALIAVGGSNLEEAIDWVREHKEDPNFNDPIYESSVVTELVQNLSCFSADQVRAALKECNGAADRAADLLFRQMVSNEC